MKHYETLDIDETADEKAIKKAYRKKAHDHHPDREDGDEEKFKDVQRAYMVLSNPKRRERYDESGGQDDQTSQVNNSLSEAYGFLSSLFGQALDQMIENLGQFDLVETVKTSILQKRQEFVRELEKQRQLAIKLKDAKRRLVNNSKQTDAVPILEQVIDANSKKVQQNIKGLEHSVEINEIMEKLISDYEWTRDDIAQYVTIQSFTTSGTTSF